MKKIFLTSLFALIFIIVSSLEVQAAPPNIPHVSSQDSYLQFDFSPRKDIIEWRYKLIDGKLYKRQYNCSQNYWIGSWTLVK